MDLGLKGKYALVTGASHGIGMAVAGELAREGCHVAICARDKKKLSAAVSLLKKKKVKVLGYPADVLIPGDSDRVIESVIKAWGTVHILVNNVGGGGRWGEPIVEKTEEKVWRDVYDKNAMAAVRFTRACIPYMRRQRWGRVVTIASVHGREGGGRPWFNMAKSAQISLMKSLALNPVLARDGLTFNSVAPGCLMIPGTGWDLERRKNPGKFKETVKAMFPMGRLGTAEEVAWVVAFLCSEKASFVSGVCVPVDGSEGKSF